MRIIQKKIFLIVFLFFISWPFISIFGEPFKVYKWGQQPKIVLRHVRKMFSKTRKLLNTSLVINIKRYEEKKSKAFYFKKTPTPMNVKVESHFQRILVMNPTSEKKELYICLEYFYVYNSGWKGGKRGTRVITSDETKKRKLYTIQIFKIDVLKSKQRIIIDTPPVDYVPGARFGRYLQVRKSPEEKFYNLRGYIGYEGVILSIFRKNKLIYQVTDSRKLKKKGLAEISPELIRKYGTETFVLAKD